MLDFFLGLVTDATAIGNIAMLVKKVAFYSCLSPKYDLMTYEEAVDSKRQDEDILLHPCAPLLKLLCQGSFYFSHGPNITRSMQYRLLNPAVGEILDEGDSHFIWNQNFLADLIRVITLLIIDTENRVE
jgi:hypothetical protein